MKGMTLSNILAICGGKLYGSSHDMQTEVTGITTDSRNITPGCLFVPLKGTQHDGHAFLSQALSNGALCCLSEQSPDPTICGPIITVPSTPVALQQLAAFYRKQFSLPVIGITGSVGKTTTKEMLAAVLSQHFHVMKTQGNFNNELGVPLTLFSLDESHTAAVVEMGISEFGEMRRLTQMASPDYSILTAIGDGHLEVLGDRNGVLRAKSEILEGMPKTGIVFCNGDDPLLQSLCCDQKKVLYGTGTHCDIHAEHIEYHGLSEIQCEIVAGSRRIPVTIHEFGVHMVYAALAACAVGIHLGLSDDALIKGIAAYRPVSGRADIIKTGSCTIIDGSYNANPTSVASALASLSDISGRKVCILGDMKELGQYSELLHKEIGILAAQQHIDLIIACGIDALQIYAGAKEMHANCLYFKDKKTLISVLHTLISPQDTVLVKASHSMHFEEVIASLRCL